MKSILIAHQSFPGQFERLIPYLSGTLEIYGIGLTECNSGIRKYLKQYWRYSLNRQTNPHAHPVVHEVETKVIRGECIFQYLRRAKLQGFSPDYILVHPGWGEAIFLKQLFPNSKLISYHEYYYSITNSDMDYDPESITSDLSKLRMELKNAMVLQNLVHSDLCITPTFWQKSRFPNEFEYKFFVKHEGVDFKKLDHALTYQFSDQNFVFPKKYITYMSRTLEPYRGFHTFVRSIPLILQRIPDLHIIIIGSETGSGYGASPLSGTWKDVYYSPIKPKIDESRVHFLGALSYSDYVQCVKNSLAHIYLSYPFVLSWSALETMYLKTPIIANKIPMIQEVFQNNHNALLVDFFDSSSITEAIYSIVSNAKLSLTLSTNAQIDVLNHYNSETNIPQIIRKITDL